MGLLFESFWIDAAFSIAALFAAFYHFWTLHYNYWKDCNVPYLKPSFPFGNMKDVILANKYDGNLLKDMYFQLKGHKYGGYINMRTPTLLLRDPEIIKTILTKDFNHFTDRVIPFDEKIDPLLKNLTTLTGERWKNLRSKLTPTFTSRKMKIMFNLVRGCSKLLRENLSEFAERGDVIELKDFMARFTTDVLGACALGLEIDSINNPDNEFRMFSNKLLKPRFSAPLFSRNLINGIIPGLSTMIRRKAVEQDFQDFFIKVVRETVEYREKTNVKHHDLLDLLIEIKNKGKLDDESPEKVNSNSKGVEDRHSQQQIHHTPSNDLEITDELMAAQCFGFFIAGFESTATALSFCLYELALNQSIQRRLQKEVDAVLDKLGGEISYEALKEMTYMDLVIQETLRKYSPAPAIWRLCTSDYTLKERNVRIKKGTMVTIPVFGIHYDPEYYPDPERFDPERFTEEAKQSRHHYTWLPFGEGPRICIGLRFALMQVKAGLATVLSKFNFERAPETLVPMELAGRSFTTTSKAGIKIKISKCVK